MLRIIEIQHLGRKFKLLLNKYRSVSNSVANLSTITHSNVPTIHDGRLEIGNSFLKNK